MAKTLLEDFIAQLNANVFFAEFAFPSTEISLPGEGQVELADHLVLLDDIGLIYQLKEREATASVSPADVEAWFENKVRKRAVKQIRATRELLARFRGSRLRNQRGHEVPVAPANIDALVGVIVYRAPKGALQDPAKYVSSRSAGFVHLISDIDYLGVCQYLVTPAEIFDYLAFRQSALSGAGRVASSISEAALVGQYIGGDPAEPPSRKYEGVLGAILEDPQDWDMSFFTENLGNQIAYREGDTTETSHYRILLEFAKLSRSELREFKKRLLLALEAVKVDRYELPYRMACPRTGCGFLILPVPKELQSRARSALANMSIASKHEYDVTRHVSLSICERSPYVDIEWMYTEGENEPNPELDELLRRNYPFRSSSERMMPRYFLDSDRLRRTLEDG